MAVPKKRTGASAQGHRRSNWKATKPAISKCQNCGDSTLAHTVCTSCGYYKGAPVRLADKKEPNAGVPEIVAKEVKKEEPAKKVTKKTVKAEEKTAEVKTKAKKAKAANNTETAQEIEEKEQKPQ